uniref:Uncharacterized protein n=1 Tax=Strigamia maritima TaxID=126957 RepID=T1JCT8_STRMM
MTRDLLHHKLKSIGSNTIMDEVTAPHVDVTIEPATIEKDFLHILQQIRPLWDKNNVVFEASEKKFQELLQPLDCAPTIAATFANGFCYHYYDGVILDHTMPKQEPIWREQHNLLR